MRIRLRRRHIRIAGGVLALLGFLGACYVLGREISPWGLGRPLVLSPSVYAAERYRRIVLEWLEEWERIDRGLSAVLAEEECTDPTCLYELGQQAEQMVEAATVVARDADFTPAPVPLAGLAERVREVAGAYLAAAQATGRWVGAPEPENRHAALDALRLARGLRLELMRAPWLRGG